MKANVIGIALVAGMLAALPARAAWGINNATYASRFRNPAQPAAIQAKPEIQVAVMADGTSAAAKPGAKDRGATDARPWGPTRPCAVKSH